MSSQNPTVLLSEVPSPHQNLFSSDSIYQNGPIESVCVQGIKGPTGRVAPHDHKNEGLMEIVHLGAKNSYPATPKEKEIARLGSDDHCYVIGYRNSYPLHGSKTNQAQGEWLSIKVDTKEISHKTSYIMQGGSALTPVYRHHFENDDQSLDIVFSRSLEYLKRDFPEPDQVIVLPLIGNIEEKEYNSQFFNAYGDINHTSRYLAISEKKK